MSILDLEVSNNSLSQRIVQTPKKQIYNHENKSVAEMEAGTQKIKY